MKSNKKYFIFILILFIFYLGTKSILMGIEKETRHNNIGFCFGYSVEKGITKGLFIRQKKHMVYWKDFIKDIEKQYFDELLQEKRLNELDSYIKNINIFELIDIKGLIDDLTSRKVNAYFKEMYYNIYKKCKILND